MRYGLVNWTKAARAPDQPGVLGYLFNHGGLNNQKMALVALLLSGIKERQAVNLPYIHNRDQRTDAEEVVAIGSVFDLGRIMAFARQHDLTVLADCPSGERGGWDCFRAFQGFLDCSASLAVVLDAVAMVKPLIAADPAFLTFKTFVFGVLGIDTVVQLRIEADWAAHVQHIQVAAGEENGLGFSEIIGKIRKTFPDLRRVYVTCDEPSMPVSKQEIRQFCRDRFGLELFWKSDLLLAPFAETLTALDLSLIDFEIARYSPRFVGLTSSTFANMLVLEKFAATRQPVRGHYIYNHPGDVVVERRDDGFTCTAGRAVNTQTRELGR